VEFYVQEAINAGFPVLEIGCGTGRIMIPTAEAGISITGLDRAPSMLEIARRKISILDKDTQSRIKLVEGDMRDFSLKDKFNIISALYSPL
jgi:ubiquinone/menaquinone biosynthesis C-methylase UbiE